MDTWSGSIWTRALRSVILPAGDLAFGQRIMSRLRFLEEAQQWDPDRLRGAQDELLRSLVRTAYHEVPFYRERMDAAGVRPDAIRTIADLHRLPRATKGMLRAGYPERTTRATGFRAYEVRSSGSTGANFAVREDTETRGLVRASFLLAAGWSGWRIGEPHLQMGMTLARSLDRRFKDLLLRCHYASAFDLTDAALDADLAGLDRHRIAHAWGYPGSLYLLARRAAAVGWNRPLRAVLTWGDTLYPHYRRAIEAAFRTRVFDTYGCGEGIQVAAQCGTGDAYHLHALDVLVESVNEAGEPVRHGEAGQLLLTRLHPGPMPLIRYEVGDVGALGNEPPCSCGRGFPLLASIQGRDTDIITTPSGNRLIVHFFTGILEHFPEIETFQVVQESSEAILLRVVPSGGFDDGTPGRIVRALRDRGAADLRIDIEPVERIPLPPSGKRRFVIRRSADAS